MKTIIIIIMALCSMTASAQIFKPDPKPSPAKIAAMKSALAIAPAPIAITVVHPLVGVSAVTYDGTQLAGGFGIGVFHRVWDDPSQSYATQYSGEIMGFVNSKGEFIAGAAIGFLGIFSVGWGYNFPLKAGQILTGVTLTPF